MQITDDIKYIGVDDRDITLFEAQFAVERGMAYNSYLVLDEKLTVFDTVERHFGDEWFANIRRESGGRDIDYLVVQHMEPDHSTFVATFAQAYPKATIVASAQAFAMMKNFFGTDYVDRRIVVKDGDTLTTGAHTFAFVSAPMVHWPEVIVTYDTKDKVLFSADGFGKFGANGIEDPEGWDCEARRYYFGIVGKFGAQVQALLKKAAALDIEKICPLHGPVLATREEVAHAVAQYSTWSSYGVETPGVAIAYTSVYGNTALAASKLKGLLVAAGCPKVASADLIRDDIHETVEDAFRYGTLVLATTTYNGGVFPRMREFVNHLVSRNYCNRRVAIVENGSWAPAAARTIKDMFASCKGIEFVGAPVTVKSTVTPETEVALAKLADEIMKNV